MGNAQGVDTWATPYALSINGDFLDNRQCPFNNGSAPHHTVPALALGLSGACSSALITHPSAGNGYGDGRAVSLGEVAWHSIYPMMLSPQCAHPRLTGWLAD